MKKTYPSRHLAENALCRMFDQGKISYEAWLASKTVRVGNRFALIIQEPV